MKAALEAKSLLLKDQTWPFQHWNPTAGQMEIDPKKQPMSMTTLTKLIEELIDQVQTSWGA